MAKPRLSRLRDWRSRKPKTLVPVETPPLGKARYATNGDG